MTPLLQAVTSQNSALVRDLIRQGHDVNELDSNGDSPLIVAAYNGYTDIVQLLLEAGANVTVVDPSMRATALHAAAYAGHAEVARLLIAHHIDIDAQGPRNGYTALHDAIWQDNRDVARILIEAGANLQLKSHAGETPLAFAQAKRRNEIAAMITRALTP